MLSYFLRPGFTGVTCNSQINSCIGKPCLNGATCRNQGNNYACTCAPGYTGAICQTSEYSKVTLEPVSSKIYSNLFIKIDNDYKVKSTDNYYLDNAVTDTYRYISQI